MRPPAARQLDAEIRVRRVQQQQVLAAREQRFYPRGTLGAFFDVKQPAASHGQTLSHVAARRTVRWSA